MKFDFKSVPAHEKPDSDKLWQNLFSPEKIKEVFYQFIFPKGGQGVDRISVFQYEQKINEDALIISRKCLAGTYKFSPYLEQLQSKGKEKKPRIISIPTVRDKIVLKLLTEFLHASFNNHLAKDLPNTVVKKIKKEIQDNAEGISYIKIDLKDFYGSINHQKLLSAINGKINHPAFSALLRRSLINPTLPAGYSKGKRKTEINSKGVPQGLSISNILAEIYIAPLDLSLRPLSNAYFRFVDDIFILCPKDKILDIWKEITKSKTDLGVEISEEKSTPTDTAWKISEGFEFLGYKFSNNKLSVRDTSYHKFVQSIIGKSTRFRHDLRKEGDENAGLKKQIFIEDINERITGAIDGNKRYGWIFFFSEIDDIKLLQKIDMIISRAIERLPNFDKKDLKKIKRVSRAYYEANHTPKRGYIHNYNMYETTAQKVKYLSKRGHLKEGAQYTDDQIDQIFSRVKTNNLLKLERDIGILS